ncbi:MAG: hypothetical protein ACE5KF_07700 [Kiloniellaceae bacterium]
MSNVPAILPFAPAPPPAGPVPSPAGAERRGRPIAAIGRVSHLQDEARAGHSRQGPGGSQRSQEPKGTHGLPVVVAVPGAGPPRDPSNSPSSHFLVQMLGQKLGPSARLLTQHRDGPVLGSDAYRRAGGEPALYTDQATVFRIAV